MVHPSSLFIIISLTKVLVTSNTFRRHQQNVEVFEFDACHLIVYIWFVLQSMCSYSGYALIMPPSISSVK